MTTEARKESTRRWRTAHPERMRELKRAYYLRNQERLRQKARDAYTPEKGRAKAERERDSRRAKRAGVIPSRPEPSHCEACGDRLERRGPSRGCLDHDHLLQKFRGWLCNRCNVALGALRDDPLRIKALASYLDRFIHGEN